VTFVNQSHVNFATTHHKAVISMKFDLDKIIKGLSNTTGEVFFDTLCLNLHECIDADYTIIARLNDAKNAATTLTMVAKGELADSLTYSLKGTPCEDVCNDALCCFPTDIQTFYPDDAMFADLNIDGYIGTPLKDSTGDVFGLLLALFEQETSFPDDILALFELFSGRVSAEIERTEAAADLQLLNESLEKQVQQRTSELQDAMHTLKETMTALADQAKMASLGQLVAGISHEINTPLGVAILANSTVSRYAQQIIEKINTAQLSKPQLLELTQYIAEGNESVQHNLQRASDLITNFKKVSIDKNTDEIMAVDLSVSIASLIKSMQPEALERHIDIVFTCPKHCVVETWPSDISQITSNLVMNSLVHAFPKEQQSSEPPYVNIVLAQNGDRITLTVRDNGIGIAENIINNIFDPFFTTKRGSGGTGLGLNIVYNIVKEKLEGDLAVKSEMGGGSQFIVTFASASEANV